MSFLLWGTKITNVVTQLSFRSNDSKQQMFEILKSFFERFKLASVPNGIKFQNGFKTG